jgi:hypothetical protein
MESSFHGRVEGLESNTPHDREAGASNQEEGHVSSRRLRRRSGLMRPQLEFFNGLGGFDAGGRDM